LLSSTNETCGREAVDEPEVPSKMGLKRSILAVVLAYALALQTIIGALASGVHAAGTFDAADHSLCSPANEGGSDQRSTPAHHTGLCILTCGSILVGVHPATPDFRRAHLICVEVVAIPRSESANITGIPHPFEARAPPSVLV
jgi:hypothetical protein